MFGFETVDTPRPMLDHAMQTTFPPFLLPVPSAPLSPFNTPILNPEILKLKAMH